VEPGQDGADGPYLGGSFGLVADNPPAPYATPPTLPAPTALAACGAAGAPGVDGAGGAGAADARGAAGRRAEGRLEVPARRVPGAPDLPASTTADAGGHGFPLATMLAVALLLAVVLATRPWRWLPIARRPDSDDG